MSIKSIKSNKLIIYSLIILVILSACSRVQLAYNQLDWLIPWYINRYIPLNEQQDSRLEQHVDRFMHWHCSTQLPLYASWFERVSVAIKQNKVDKENIARFSTELRSFWHNIADNMVPGLANILFTANKTQTSQLFKNISEDLDEFRDELVDARYNDIANELYDRMEDRFDTWIGDLSAVQEKALRQWSLNAVKNQPLRLNARERWMNALHRSFIYRTEQKVFTKQVHFLFRHSESIWTPEYEKMFHETRNEIHELIVFTLNNLTDKQHRHLKKRLKSWKQDMLKLSCKPS